MISVLCCRYVTACSFSPTSPLIATGSMDKTVSIWRLEDACSGGGEKKRITHMYHCHTVTFTFCSIITLLFLVIWYSVCLLFPPILSPMESGKAAFGWDIFFSISFFDTCLFKGTEMMPNVLEVIVNKSQTLLLSSFPGGILKDASHVYSPKAIPRTTISLC